MEARKTRPALMFLAALAAPFALLLVLNLFGVHTSSIPWFLTRLTPGAIAVVVGVQGVIRCRRNASAEYERAAAHWALLALAGFWLVGSGLL